MTVRPKKRSIRSNLKQTGGMGGKSLPYYVFPLRLNILSGDKAAIR